MNPVFFLIGAFWVVAAVLVVAATVSFARRRSLGQVPSRERVSASVEGKPYFEPASVIVGAATVDGVRVTWPFAELAVSDNRIVIRGRLGFAGMFDEVRIDREEVDRVEDKGRLGRRLVFSTADGRLEGVAFRPLLKWEPLLNALTQAGWPVVGGSS